MKIQNVRLKILNRDSVIRLIHAGRVTNAIRNYKASAKALKHASAVASRDSKELGEWLASLARYSGQGGDVKSECDWVTMGLSHGKNC